MGKVMIFSNRKGGRWWASDFSGYTDSSGYAGIYEYEDVIKKYPNFTFDDTTPDYMVEISDEEAERILKYRQMKKEIKESLKKDSISLGININEVDIKVVKKLKAFEIIKEKGLSFIEIALLKCCNDYSEYECEIAERCYRSSFENQKAHKTREEFDLLKELLI